MVGVHAGLDLSRRRLDVCLLSADGEVVTELPVPPDRDGLAGLVRRAAKLGPVRAVIESMTGARFVHDTLEQHGWDVRIADAHKVNGLAPLACKTDRIDSRVLALRSHRELTPRSGCRTRGCAPSANRPASGCTWSSTRACSSTAFTRR
jgi:hypothetical protein